MSDIFISYANTDRDIAQRIASALTGRGHAVWWDRTIPPGRIFDEVIQEALAVAKCVVVLWSKASVASNWVKAESDEAAKRGILVPVLVEEVTAPFEFRRIQSANLIGWDDEADHPEFQHLLAAVDRVTRGPGVPPRADVAPRTTQRWIGSGTRRVAVWTTAVVVVALLVGVAASFLQRRAPIEATGEETNAAGAGAAEVDAATATPHEQATSVRTANAPPSAAPSSAAPSAAITKGKEIDLLSTENGGQVVAASSEAWSRLIDGDEGRYAYIKGQEGVFAFKDERPASFHAVAILIKETDGENIKDFELLVGSDSPTGRFDSIGTFTTQNLRLFKSPYQAFTFPSAKARYVKFKPLTNHGGGGYLRVYEIRLLGQLE